MAPNLVAARMASVAMLVQQRDQSRHMASMSGASLSISLQGPALHLKGAMMIAINSSAKVCINFHFSRFPRKSQDNFHKDLLYPKND